MNKVPVISHLPAGPGREVLVRLENVSGIHDPVVLICPGVITLTYDTSESVLEKELENRTKDADILI